MRALLWVGIAFLLHSPVLLAQEKSPSANVEFPAEYKAFFDEYSALKKKYPTAASRFGMFDRKNPSYPKAPGSAPIIRSSQCGIDWCCTKWVDEGPGFDRCVQCSFCPP